MKMALADKKILNPIRYHQDNTDVVIAQASAMKELFDQGAEDVRVKLNGVIDELIATTGAQQIGIDPARGLGNTLADALTNIKNYMNLGASGISATTIGTGSGNTVQSQLEWLLLQIQNVLLNQIPDGTITMQKLATELADAINGNTSNIGDLTSLTTTEKTNLVGAVNELVSQLAHKATKTELALKTDKTYVDAELTKKANTGDVTLKADKTYVDSEIAKKASGAPKGAYATLIDLQTAFPTGDNGNYVVTANGHIYNWSGSAWTDTGILYQAVGVANNSVGYSNLKTMKWAELSSGVGAYLNINTTTKQATLTSNIFALNDDGYKTALAGTVSYNDVNTTFICVNRSTGALFVQDITQVTSAYAFIICRIVAGKIYSPFGYKYIKVNGATPTADNIDYVLPNNFIGKNNLNFTIPENIPNFLKNTDNLQTLLDSGQKLIMLSPDINYSFNNITVPSGVSIIGNGATITSPNTLNPIFKIGTTTTDSTDVVIKDIKFRGATSNANNLACIPTDIAIDMVRTARVTITGCEFNHFLGAGISTQQYASTVTRESQSNIIQGNTFTYCYYGFINWKDSEFGIFNNNNISYCRCGIWSLSGNWTYDGNIVVRCRAGFVSTTTLNDIVTSTGTNFQHGTVVGNTFNHDIPTQTTAWNTSNYLINSIDFVGIYIDGKDSAIPPLFSGNTFYYTDFGYYNSSLSAMPFWYLTGCVISNCSVYCDQVDKVGIVACVERSNVTKTNVVKLI